MTRSEIEARADAQDQIMLANSAPASVFRYALDHGWISQTDHDQARAQHGRRWHYTGD